ncbi:hypothetical protein CsSME_00016854 [Camellia sinensis var. sinensis]
MMMSWNTIYVSVFLLEGPPFIDWSWLIRDLLGSHSMFCYVLLPSCTFDSPFSQIISVQLQHHARHRLPTFQLIFVHVIESLVFVPVSVYIYLSDITCRCGFSLMYKGDAPLASN